MAKPPDPTTNFEAIPAQQPMSGDSLYVAIGIFRGTVMPLNLYLQSGLLTRAVPATLEEHTAARANRGGKHRFSVVPPDEKTLLA